MAQQADWTEIESPEAQAEQSLDLLRILWRRKWIVICVSIIAGALGYLYYLQATRVYRSVAQVLLVKRDSNVALAGSRDGRGDRGAYGSYEDTLSTHMLIICSPMIVRKAVEKNHLETYQSVKALMGNNRDAVSVIIQGLKATRAGDRANLDPNVMNLWYEGLDPRESMMILKAVIQTYQETLTDTYQTFSEETVQLIGQAKDVLHKQLSEKEAAYRQFRQESPLLWKGPEAANVHEARMVEIEKSRSGVLVHNAEVRARIEAIQTALQQGGSREALALLARKSQANAAGVRTARDDLEEKLFLFMLEREDLLQSFGSDHPRVMAVDKRLNLLRERLGNMPLPEVTDSVDFIAVYLESLRQELKVGEEQLAEYDGLFEQERRAAKEMAQHHIKDETYKAEIERTKQMFDAVVKRLEEISLVKDYGGISTQLLVPPSLGELVRPVAAIVIGLSGVLGLLAGFGLAYLVDMADKSFRSPQEIRKLLGLPVIGHIPVIQGSKTSERDPDGKPRLSPVLASYHHPKSRSAEAYRAVRTALYFCTHGEGLKVIQVTSPTPGDGKTTLAANLAVSMADSGKKVLLMEADFRRPRVHQYFSLDNTIGVSSAISGEAEILDAIQQTSVANLSAMPCGPKPNNPSDLLTSPRFKEVIDCVRDRYDYVIIDTPPMLAVTDSSVVAPRVDAVLLVMRLTKHAREGALRATEMLGALGARILGVVVNGIGKTSGYGYGYQRYSGYRYGAYNYRYTGYRYGYGSYGGNGEAASGYYAEEEASSPSRTAAPKAVPRSTDT